MGEEPGEAGGVDDLPCHRPRRDWVEFMELLTRAGIADLHLYDDSRHTIGTSTETTDARAARRRRRRRVR